MIKQDILENRVRSVYLGIGSNLGNRADNIEKTKFHLSHFCYFLKISKLYETPSWPNQSNPKFLNLIIECKTDLTIIDLFEKIKKIETLLGRKKSIKNAPRTCDIDIIDFKVGTAFALLMAKEMNGKYNGKRNSNHRAVAAPLCTGCLQQD